MFVPSRLCLAMVATLVVALVSPLAAADREKARKQLDKAGVAFTPEQFLLRTFLDDDKLVRLFLDAGMSPDTKDDKGEVPLVTSARQTDGKVMAMLLKAGADPNLADSRRTTPLCQAAGGDSLRNVQVLLAAGATVTTVCGFGRTALHEAASAGNGPIVSALIAAGASLESRAERAETPLYLAVKATKPDAVQALLAAGADPNTKLGNGQTALHEAVEWNHPERVTVLLDGGAAIDAKDASGQTPLHLAAATGRMALIPLLLQRGADPAAKTRQGETPRQLAIRSNSREAAALLAGATRIPTAARTTSAPGPAPVAPRPSASGQPKADLAKMGLTFDEETFWDRLEAEDVKAVTLFVKGGLSSQLRNRLGRTPLWVAVERGDAGMVQALLDLGANPNDAGKGHPSMDFGESLALKAVDLHDPAILMALIARGTDVNAANRYGTVPLHEAARQGKLEMVQALIGAHANPNARAGNAPVLHGPVMEDHIDVVRVLLDAGARPGTDRAMLLKTAKSAGMKQLLQQAK